MKSRGFIKLQRELLTQPEVADLLAEEGAAGLGIFVAVNLYLAHCEGGWGAFNGCQLSTMAVQLKKHRSDVKRVICDYGLFVIEDTRFTSHWMQQLFGKNTAKMLQGCSTPACSYNLRAEDIDIDKDIEKENKKCVRHKGTHSEFEITRAGRRYASHGQPLPADAPPQRRRNDMYSYLRHDWVPADEFDKDAEMKVYHQLFDDNKTKQHDRDRREIFSA